MQKLTVEDLLTLEEYAEKREVIRKDVITHKNNRKLHIGPNMTLLFEDRLLIQYQVQEMLRIERIFEKEGIQEELDAYNPLIPDGSNLKATCLIEFEDVDERKQALKALRGIEKRIWVQVGEGQRRFAIADEDMDRSDEEKTSAVHFLRFELPPQDAADLKGGAALRFGVDCPGYAHQVDVPSVTRKSLAKDLA